MPRLKKQSIAQRKAKNAERMLKKRSDADFSAKEEADDTEEQEGDTLRHDKTRSDSEVRAKKQTKNTVNRRQARLDPLYRKKEQNKNTDNRREARLNPLTRKKEQKKDTVNRGEARLNPLYRDKERKKDTDNRREARLNPLTRKKEQKKDTVNRGEARLNPLYRDKERKKDTDNRREARLNPLTRKKEQKKDTVNRGEARLNPLYRDKERKKDTDNRREARLNPLTRKKEQKKDTVNRGEARLNPLYRDKERKKDTVNRGEARLDPLYRGLEQVDDRDRRNEARQKEKEKVKVSGKASDSRVKSYRSDDANRAAESTRQSERNKLNRSLMDDDERAKYLESKRNDYTKGLLKNYNEKVRQGPTVVCNCCGGLLFHERARKLNKCKVSEKRSQAYADKVFALSFRSEYIEKENLNVFELCNTCYNDINDGKVPNICLNNGLHFPEIPDCLKGLTVVEEILCAPRIPFMRICSLGYERQSGLKGSVVNIPITVDTTVSALPRTMDDTYTIQLHLKRKLSMKHNYMCETIRPARVLKAVQYLVGTELFTRNGVLLSTDWLENFEDIIDDNTEVPFVVNETDVATVEELLQNNTENEEMEEDEEDFHGFTEEDLNPGGQETLLDNTDIEGIALAPGEGKRPLNMFTDEDSEELSFVTIYGGFKRKPTVNLGYVKIARSELRRYDRRCARIDKLLYTYKRLEYSKVHNALNTQLRKRKSNDTVTVTDVLNDDFVNTLVKRDEAYRFLEDIGNSPAHWEKEKKNAIAMIRQFNIGTFFITLSAAETKWEELLAILSLLVDGKYISLEEAKHLQFAEKARLIRSDPVTCARYFEYRFKTIFNLFKRKNGIFGKHYVTHFYYRVEFQHRGSPHVHGIYYLNDAPIFNPEDPESFDKVTDFIDEFVTCDSSMEGLEEFVEYQKHSHAANCRRTFKSKTFCRYHYPMPPMKKTSILLPLEIEEINQEMKDNYDKIQSFLNSSRENEDLSFEEFLKLPEIDLTEEDYILAIRSNIKKTTIFLKRSLKDINVNGFNPAILALHRANMDIQFILDPYACIGYIVDYINKSNRGMSRLLKEASDEADKGNMTFKAKLRHIANKFSNATEISAQECVYIILGMNLSKISNEVTYINTSQPHEREHYLKARDELEEIKRVNPNSTDKFKDGMIEHYSQRPVDGTFSDMCLADFAAWYTYKKKPVGNSIPLQNASGFIQKRTQTRIIRFRNYSVNKDAPDYYREQIMLYYPWRNEDTDILKLDYETFYKAHADIISVNRKKYNAFDTDEEFERATRILDRLGFEEDDQLDEEFRAYAGNNDEDADIYEAGAANEANKNFSNNPSSISGGINIPSEFPEAEFLEWIETLNTEQRLYLTHILSNIKKGVTFYECIGGGAGSGKSQLINAIFQSIHKYYLSIPGNDDSIKVLITGPTGKAASNVDGMTLHSAFSMRVTKNPELLKKGQLGASMRNTFYTLYMNLKVVIIDEISLVGSRLFYNLDIRLQEIFKSDLPFGGVSLLIIGDFFQINPVRDKFVFYGAQYSNLVGSPLWELFRYFELIKCMRQLDDQPFALALNHLARGELTAEDIELFKSREVQSNADVPDNGIHLFRSNAEVERYNAIVLARNPSEEIIAAAVDRVRGNISQMEKDKTRDRVKYFETKDTMGLPYELVCKVAAKYMMTVNIDTADGLVNGSTGLLKHVDCTNDPANIKKKIPILLWIEFHMTKSGRRARSGRTKFLDTNWTPVLPTVRTFQSGRSNNIVVDRKQFPIVCAEALTFHKCQGGTYLVVAVHPVPGMTRAALYVGCSRATKASGLYIVGKFKVPGRMDGDTNVKVELDFIKEDRPLIPTYLFLTTCPENLMQILFHNVQSLRKHYALIKNDDVFIRSDLLLFVETFTSSFDFPDFYQFAKLDNDDANRTSNAGKGMACYVKNKHKEFVKNVKCGYKYRFPNADSEKYFMYCLFRLYNAFILVIYKSNTCSTIQLKNGIVDIMHENKINLIQEKKVFVFGDFNIDLFKEANNDVAQYFAMNNINCLLDNTVPTTRVGTQIDWLHSNINPEQAMFGTYETVFSHHKPLYLQTYFNETPVDPIHPLKREVQGKDARSIVATKRVSIATIKQRERKAANVDISKKESLRSAAGNKRKKSSDEDTPKKKGANNKKSNPTIAGKVTNFINNVINGVKGKKSNDALKGSRSPAKPTSTNKATDTSGTKKDAKRTPHIPGFEKKSTDNCSFANSSLQCLLANKNINHNIIMRTHLNTALKMITRKYNDNDYKVLRAENVIRYAGLKLGQEHEPHIFLNKLLNEVEHICLKGELKYTLVKKLECRNTSKSFKCVHSLVRRTTENILRLPVVSEKELTMEKIVHDLSRWRHMSEFTCRVCKEKKVYGSFSVENASDTLIISLNVIDSKFEVDFHATELCTAPLNISRSTYMLKSAILGGAKSKKGGGFRSIVKHNDRWYLLWDLDVTSMFGVKICRNVSVLFYEKQRFTERLLNVLPPGFSNNNSTSFANAALQCLLSNRNINANILKEKASPLKNLAIKYNNHKDKVLVSDEIITILNFKVGLCEDACNFLESCFKNFTHLQKEIAFTKTHAKRCQNTKCNYIYSKDKIGLMMNLVITSDMENRDLRIYEILEKATSWNLINNFECPLCTQKTVEESHYVNSASNTLILSFDIFSRDNASKHKYILNIKELSTSNLQICKSIYKLKSAIFHIGNTLLGEDVHYYVLHRFQNDMVWYKFDDYDITKSTFPVNSNNAYILFYEIQLDESSSNNNNAANNNDVTNKNTTSSNPTNNNATSSNTNNNTSILNNPGFINPKGTFCYANASLQCIFLNKNLNKKILTSTQVIDLEVPETDIKPLQLLATAYNNCTSRELSAQGLINHFNFDENRQQDSSEFLYKVLQTYTDLSPEVSNRLHKYQRCNNYNCNFTAKDTNEDLNYNLMMPIIIKNNMNDKKPVTIYELLDAQHIYEPVDEDFECPLCKLPMISERFIITKTSNTLILLLNTYYTRNGLAHQHKIKIKDLPNSPLEICNSKYVLKSAIFHYGPSPSSGHYIAKYKVDDIWYELNDTRISQSFWPENSEDVYVLFYERQTT